MTFSIVALDPLTGDVGAAVASKFLAVGNIVPWVAAGSGAVATQALCNARFGPEGLARLGREPASEVLASFLAADPGRERRQVGMVDVNGGSASHTGSGCQKWAGHRTGFGYACQGNCLAGEAVVEAMADAFERTTGQLFVRLNAALKAGDKAGGDRRGRQSAAIKVMRAGAGYQGLGDTVMDLRVDDHADPLTEMQRLMDIHDLYFPTGAQERVALDGAVLEELRAMVRSAGRLRDETPGWTPEFRAALDGFIGTENLEERVDLDARTIDLAALRHLRRMQL